MAHRRFVLKVDGEDVPVEVESEASTIPAGYGFPAHQEVYVFTWSSGQTVDTPTSRSVMLLIVNRRLLAPLRLSHLTDASLNPEGQRRRINSYAEDNGDEVIFVDVDMDVSGAVPIRQRPGLGAWLASDRISQIDGICADEADRLSRDMLDYLQFARDMAAMGKIIIDVSDGTDTSTERGRQALEDRILAAQRERERMATRRRKAKREAVTEGRWDGGGIPFGYEPRCDCHKERLCPVPARTTGWRLYQGANVETVRWMIHARIDGMSFSEIARQLTAQNISTSRDLRICDCHDKRRCPDPEPTGWHSPGWKPTAVAKILKSPTLRGYKTTMQNKVQVVVRDKHGSPVMLTTEPIIEDAELWHDLQNVIKTDARNPGQPLSRHMLYRVLFCRTCSPRPLNPETAVLMYGANRYTARSDYILQESISFTSDDQVRALGAIILNLRKAAGLSLSQLESLTTVTDGHLNRIERGIQRASIKKIRLIASAFNTTAEELIAQVPGLEILPERPSDFVPAGYYQCKQCGLGIRIDMIEPLIRSLVLSEVGERVLLERHIIIGDDHAAEISRLVRAAERRRELLSDEPEDEDMRRSLATIEAQIEELQRKPHEPDTVGFRPVKDGIKIADHWEALDTEGRAKFLRDWDVSCFVDRDGAETRLGYLAAYSEAFRLHGDRLAPTALPALIAHAKDWQSVPGGVLPARAAMPRPDQAN